MGSSGWIPPDGLDHEFLQFIGTSLEGQERVQSFYVPMFLHESFREGPVADLGCGEGAFVGLLARAGRTAIGVDSDAVAVEQGRARGLELVHADCLAWLREQPDGSLGGIFAAHLVEHLPYEVTLATIQDGFRALRPGGLMVLATPDPRALVTHLDMFWLHFGHHAIYHPALLAFFLKHSGFTNLSTGTNPQTGQSWWHGESALPPPSLSARPGPLRRVRNALLQWLGLDESMGGLTGTVHHNAHTLNRLIARLDQPFEGYAMGVKPSPDSTPTPA